MATGIVREINKLTVKIHTKKKTMEQTTIKVEGCPHIQLEGQAYYDERKYFMFTPMDPVPGQAPRFNCYGRAQQMTDGTFDFMAQPRLRAKSTLIRKLAHGRVSRTKNGDVQLWLKISPAEQLNIGDTISREASSAAEAIREWQMKN